MALMMLLAAGCQTRQGDAELVNELRSPDGRIKMEFLLSGEEQLSESMT